MKSNRPAFTLIELLVVVAIIATLISILVPALSAARATSKSLKCQTNIRSMAQMTQAYLDSNRDMFPVRDNAAPGGGSIYNAFLPARTILRYDKRPTDIFACPSDEHPVRLYTVGDGTNADPNSIGIGDVYGMQPSAKLRFSYGLNNMTGINPTTDAEHLLFNPSLTAYSKPAETLFYADCSFFNARGHNVAVNDEPRLKSRVANASAPSLQNTLTAIPPENANPQPDLRRHKGGSNIVFLDHHVETVTQEDCFKKVLYSWTEPVATPPPGP